MGASLWDQVGLPLLIGLAIQIAVSALCFLSVRLWKCLMKHIKPQTAVEESAHDQPLPDGDAAAHANTMPDLETGNGYGPAESGDSVPKLELEMGIVMNGGEDPKTGDATRGALVVPVKMDHVPHSQQEEAAAE